MVRAILTRVHNRTAMFENGAYNLPYSRVYTIVVGVRKGKCSYIPLRSSPLGASYLFERTIYLRDRIFKRKLGPI